VAIFAERLAPVLADVVDVLLDGADDAPPEAGELVAVDVALGLARRAAAKLCREGHVEAAVLVARRWRAPQAAIDAYLARARGPRRKAAAPPANDTSAAPANVAAFLGELGLERVAGGRR
jgi:hypothetical protein